MNEKGKHYLYERMFFYISQKNLHLRDFNYILLTHSFMNTNNIKTQLFHSIKYDLKGHLRSHKLVLFLNQLFL